MVLLLFEIFMIWSGIVFCLWISVLVSIYEFWNFLEGFISLVLVGSFLLEFVCICFLIISFDLGGIVIWWIMVIL